MTNFSEYRIIKSDGTPITLPVVDKTALHEDAASNKYIIEQASGYFKHVNPYVRLTTADIQKSPGGDPLVPYIVQPWNTNTITTKVDNDSEIKLSNIDGAIFKDGPNKKVTLQFVVYIPDNYTISSTQGDVTDLKGTTIRSKDLHGFTVTDNNSKNSHYRVEEDGFGSFDVIDINLWSLGTVEQHNSVNYDRAVIINVKATMQYNSNNNQDELGVRLWINNEDVSKMDTLPFFIISEAGTIDPTNSLVQDNDKYSKSEIDVELAKKVDETDYKAATGITVNDWKTALGVPGNTLTGLTDTSLSTLTAGEVLTVKEKADGSGKEWVNQAASGGLSDPDRFAMQLEISRNDSSSSSHTFSNAFVEDAFNKVRLFAPSGVNVWAGATQNRKNMFTLADNGLIYDWKGNFLGTGSDNHTLTLTSGMYIINGAGYGNRTNRDMLITLSATNSNISSTSITKNVRYSNWFLLNFNNMMPLLGGVGYDETGIGYTIYLKVDDGKTSDVNFWAYQSSSNAADEQIYLNLSILKIG